MPHGLPRRIRYAFVTQGLLSVLAVVLGVSLVTLVTRNALVTQRLGIEATAFWEHGSHAYPEGRLPSTASLQGYYGRAGADGQGIPAYVQSLPQGISFLYGAQRAVLVERREDGTLYLVLRTGNLDRLMGRSAAALILIGLLAVLAITWLTYRKSRAIVLPINRLAEDVARWDPSQAEAPAPPVISDLAADASHEVRALSSALRGLAGRVSDFMQRERDFTRDASHELRTPLTVIRVASDIMLADPSMPLHSQRSLLRIQRAGRDMEAVIDAFLILAREGGVAPQSEEFDVREMVLEEVEKVRPMLQSKPVELRVPDGAAPRAFAPPRVMSVIIGHLLHNACTFTEAGSVEVTIEPDAVVVRDTGIGMSSETLQRAHDPFYRADAFSPVGKGFGLSIAYRLGRRFGWPLTLESAPGQGTTATLRFVPIATQRGTPLP
ncbi:MAG: HAMP domain-containing histidine kinase [Luteimonas sp.]|nr:HAMP domain-containing histidine kinase [Luteimonas sp.]